MIQRKRLPRTDDERRALARVELLAEQLAGVEAELWSAAWKTRDMGIDIDVIAEAARTSRATLYRRLAEVGTSPRPDRT